MRQTRSFSGIFEVFLDFNVGEGKIGRLWDFWFAQYLLSAFHFLDALLVLVEVRIGAERASLRSKSVASWKVKKFRWSFCAWTGSDLQHYSACLSGMKMCILLENQSCHGCLGFNFLYFVGNSCSSWCFHIEKSFGTYDVITALWICQGSHAEEARTLIVSMLTERLQPDVITMNSAIGANLEKSFFWRWLEFLMSKIQGTGLQFAAGDFLMGCLQGCTCKVPAMMIGPQFFSISESYMVALHWVLEMPSRWFPL